ncbi:hypothetical protein AMTR_s00030p00062580 [Amborella trichopoda]|uniref:Uncharacterized protein n=1 Tax=Amborella trichopoda TaxID=13333 RepID=U5D0U0_AMBTC|nr:hypothetical protein AMTR_s00030p00062580 [Amborella trichopoda]
MDTGAHRGGEKSRVGCRATERHSAAVEKGGEGREEVQGRDGGLGDERRVASSWEKPKRGLDEWEGRTQENKGRRGRRCRREGEGRGIGDEKEGGEARGFVPGHVYPLGAGKWHGSIQGFASCEGLGGGCDDGGSTKECEKGG